MMLVRCYLAPSPNGGVGVFTRDDIGRGQNVWCPENLLDARIAVEDLDRLDPETRDFIERYAYPDYDDPSFLILESDEGRFMNHADVPNVDFSDGEHGYARWDIPAGTELTCRIGTFSNDQHDIHADPAPLQRIAV